MNTLWCNRKYTATSYIKYYMRTHFTTNIFLLFLFIGISIFNLWVATPIAARPMWQTFLMLESIFVLIFIWAIYMLFIETFRSSQRFLDQKNYLIMKLRKINLEITWYVGVKLGGNKEYAEIVGINKDGVEVLVMRQGSDYSEPCPEKIYDFVISKDVNLHPSLKDDLEAFLRNGICNGYSYYKFGVYANKYKYKPKENL